MRAVCAYHLLPMPARTHPHARTHARAHIKGCCCAGPLACCRCCPTQRRGPVACTAIAVLLVELIAGGGFVTHILQQTVCINVYPCANTRTRAYTPYIHTEAGTQAQKLAREHRRWHASTRAQKLTREPLFILCQSDDVLHSNMQRQNHEARDRPRTFQSRQLVQRRCLFCLSLLCY